MRTLDILWRHPHNISWKYKIHYQMQKGLNFGTFVGWILWQLWLLSSKPVTLSHHFCITNFVYINVLAIKKGQKTAEQDVYHFINISFYMLLQKSILWSKHLILLFLNQTFDGLSCCPPSFNFRNVSAQACIVSALSLDKPLKIYEKSEFFSSSVSKALDRTDV